jgi:hypothetical protein
MVFDDKKGLILDELRHSFDHILDIKKTLEDKATKNITTSGIITTLLLGFISFTFDKEMKIIPLACVYSSRNFSYHVKSKIFTLCIKTK